MKLIINTLSKTLILFTLINFSYFSLNAKNQRAIAQDKEIEKKVESILKNMTLEEKVGQMTQLNFSMLVENNALSEKKMDKVFGEYKVGSILNVPFGVAQTREVYCELVKAIQEKSMKELSIPCLYGVDQIHGASYTVGATYFPQNINLAASFNRELAYKSSAISAYETRACMIPWTFAPVMDLGRNPLWPRMWESFGEDAYLNAEMASAAVKGMQGGDPNHIGLDNMAACLKHYMGYGVPVSGKDRTPAIIADNELREKYFAPFRAAIDAGALSVMVNSASINGVPVHASYKYLTQWLKEELNWDGVIVTDYNDINNLYSRDHVAESKKDAVKIAINAGVDLSMVPNDFDFCTNLVELVKEGEVPMSRIDDAVRRLLRMKFRLGLFENSTWDASRYVNFASKKFEDFALASAIESEVLLKNNNLLPLSSDSKILLLGPNANSMRPLNGGWSYSWQGEVADKYTTDYNTIFEALSAKFGSENVTYLPVLEYAEPKNDNWREEIVSDFTLATEAAKDCDVIVVCIGENSYCETPGNINDLNISLNQAELVKQLSKTGKPIMLVLNEGRPRVIREIEPFADAIVHILLPGNYGADALAQLISGDANFSAKLPFTYPKYVNSFSTYDFKPSEKLEMMTGVYNYDAKVDVQWPFGYGLSYNNYAYSNLKINKKEFYSTDKLQISIDVKNEGSMKGKEAVLLYSTDVVASTLPDVLRLRAFDKINLAPGQTKTVTFELDAKELAFVGADNKWRIEKGEFIIRCGSEYVKIACVETKVWDEVNIIRSTAKQEVVNANYKNIIPLPSSVQLTDAEGFKLKAESLVYFQEEKGSKKMQRNAEFLQEYVKGLCGYDLSFSAISAKTKVKKQGIYLLLDPSLETEEYLLSINENTVQIKGGSPAAVFYGIQSLRKSIPGDIAEGSAVLFPSVEIKDKPMFSYRGILMDCARHFFDKEYIKEVLDMLALHNMNVLHWHLTEDQGWRIEIKKYPLLTTKGSIRKETLVGHLRHSNVYDGTPYGGYYTQDDVREIVAYAAERHITVIPEIDLPGHMLAALTCYPELGCTGGPYEVATKWGIFPDVLCLGNEQTYKFLEDVLTEVMDLFPSEYIHIGGDEAPRIRWKACPKCQEMIKKQGLEADGKFTAEDKLQSYCTKRIEKFLKEHGRRIIGWDEILQGGVDASATVMSWRGVDRGKIAAQLGHDVIMTAREYLYLDYYQTKDISKEPLAIGGYLPIETVYSFRPKLDDLSEEEKKHVIGVQANLWTEYIPTEEQFEYMLFPRIAAVSEVQWMNPEAKDFEEFRARLYALKLHYDRMGINYAKHIF